MRKSCLILLAGIFAALALPAQSSLEEREQRINRLWTDLLQRPPAPLGQGLLLVQPGIIMPGTNFPKGEAASIHTNASLYNQLGNYPKALEYFLKTLQLVEKQGYRDPSAILNNIGLVYANLGDTTRAQQYFFDALQATGRAKAPHVKGVILMNLGELLGKLGRPARALEFGLEGLEILLATKGAMGSIPYALRNVGDIYGQLHRPNRALEYYRRSLVFARWYGSLPRQTETYQSLAQFYQVEGRADSAIFYAQAALQGSQSLASSRGILAAATVLSAVYEKNDLREALRYYKLAVATKDSMFNQETAERILSINDAEKQRQIDIATARREYSNSVRQYLLLAGLAVFLFIALVLYRNNRRQQQANALLSEQKRETEAQREKAELALQELQEMQVQLIHREKMASLGELTAGIAHEIQNPLNFVNNFAELGIELLDELVAEWQAGDQAAAQELVEAVQQNLSKIHFHGQRAEAIVKGMLYHSRSSTGVKESIDINLLAEEYLRLSYHGLRAKDRSFQANYHTELDPTLGKIPVIPQELGRVLLNLFNNAFYAVNEKKRQQPDFEPLVTLRTRRVQRGVEIVIHDNGPGIPAAILPKIFQPFFTTKPTQQGTGLGLSLSYEIIEKGHDGKLLVATQEGVYAEFTIFLPA